MEVYGTEENPASGAENHRWFYRYRSSQAFKCATVECQQIFLLVCNFLFGFIQSHDATKGPCDWQNM